MTFEIESFKRLLSERGVTRYLEVGARHGDTFHDVMLSLPVGSFGVAVDLPGGAWGIDSSRQSLDSAAADLIARGYQVVVIYGDSTSAEVIEQVSRLAPFDAALIDGDHRYDGVKADWLAYGHMADAVAFHDIVGVGERHEAGVNVEVPSLWAELKTQGLHTIEFLAPKSKMGIGVIFNAAE